MFKQRATAEALGVILDRAARCGLPPIDWQVSHLGTMLVGRVARPLGAHAGKPCSDDEARAQMHRTFRGYAALTEQLCTDSLKRYGPGSPNTMPTECSISGDPLTGDRLMARLRHVTIPLPGSRKTYLLRFVVHADLPSREEDR